MHAVLALLLAVLTASAVACGVTATAGSFSSMTTMDHVATAIADVRPVMAQESDELDKCLSSADSPHAGVLSSGDCGSADCAQVSGQRHPSCCDSPGQNGVSATAPAIAPPTGSSPDAGHVLAASLPRCPDAADSGRGPPDLHMLQLLRI